MAIQEGNLFLEGAICYVSPLKVSCYTVWGGRVCVRSHAVFGHLQLKTTESEGLEDLLCYDVRWTEGVYSGTSEIRTPWDLAKVYLFRRCP